MYNGPEFRESVMAECLKEVREGVTEMGWRRHASSMHSVWLVMVQS